MTLAALERWSRGATRVVAFLGLVALLALAAVLLANALARGLFAQPLSGVRDFEKLIIAVAIAAAFPAVMAARGNITIRAFGRLLPPRGAAALDLLGHLVGLAVMAILTWEIQRYTGELHRSGETTEQLGLPIAPWWQLVALLFLLATLCQALATASASAAAWRGRPAGGEGPIAKH